MQPKILSNDFKRQWREINEQVISAVNRVGASGFYILGPELEAFEKDVARFWSLPYAVGVGNGMDALEIGLRCLGIRPGDKVLTTPFSAFASTLCIMRAGGIPVFVDVDDSGAIRLDQCRELLGKDPTIRFLLPVHLYGFALPMRELARLKEEFGLFVVEDCAQAIGAVHSTIPVGSVGQVAATSFYPTKNLGTLGDAGAVLTANSDLAAMAKALRNYGQSSLYFHNEIGMNSRLDEIHAAILRTALLPNLKSWTTARAKTARAYLNDIRNPRIKLPTSGSDTTPVWHLFPITLNESRDQLREFLLARGICTGVHYPRVIPDQIALARYGRYELAFEPANARRLAASEVSLPIHPFLEKDEIAAVIEACNAWK